LQHLRMSDKHLYRRSPRLMSIVSPSALEATQETVPERIAKTGQVTRDELRDDPGCPVID